MSKTTLKGVIHNIFPTETRGNFEKRIVYLKEQGVQYGSTWELTFEQNDTNIPDNFKPGQLVICHIEVRGREWTKDGNPRVFNTLKCTMMQREGPLEESLKTAPPAASPTHIPEVKQQTTQPPVTFKNSDFIDDAPI